VTGLGLRRLQHLVLYVADVERSVQFYVDVLGLKLGQRFANNDLYLRQMTGES